MSSLINHAQLTSIETCHSFLSLSSRPQLIIRFPSKRGPAIDRSKETEVIVAQVEIQYIEYFSVRLCPPFLSLAPPPPLYTPFHSPPPRPSTACDRTSGRVVYVQYPSTHCAPSRRPALLKNRFLPRVGRATTEIAGEFFVSRGCIHGRESFFPRVGANGDK